MSLKTTQNLTIRTFCPDDEAAVVDLWQRCKLVVPWNDPHEDIMTKYNFQPDLFFVGVLERTEEEPVRDVSPHVVASIMVGYEGHRGWINYLAVDPELQRQGIGRKMMKHAEVILRELDCPKINLQVRETNKDIITFYESLGFANDHVISLGKRLRKS